VHRAFDGVVVEETIDPAELDQPVVEALVGSNVAGVLS
jgi:hypothetical protein